MKNNYGISKALAIAFAVIIGSIGLTGCNGEGAKGLAAVSKTGGLIRGINVVSVAVHPPGYVVEFNGEVDVANGYYLVTPGLTGSCNTKPNAEKWTGNSVYVSFAKSAATPTFTNCAFSLAVF